MLPQGFKSLMQTCGRVQRQPFFAQLSGNFPEDEREELQMLYARGGFALAFFEEQVRSGV